MNLVRVGVPLSREEHAALVAICEREVRPPAEQLRYWLRREARSRGLLPTDVQMKEATQCASPK